MNAREIQTWLRETDPHRLEALWADADRVRRDNVGDEVHLRGLIEVSSHCERRCLYCGLRAPRAGIERYRMTAGEVLACAAEAKTMGCGTVVLQAGEDPALTQEWVADLVRRIRAAQPALAITLSLGERTEEELAAWKEAGADRYLLRFETSDRELYERIHPSLPGRQSDRMAILAALRRLGYQVGSGVMIGIPGQTYESLARDIECFAELDLDMIGVGPFLAHPDTPLGNGDWLDSRCSENRACPHFPSEDGDRHRFLDSENSVSPRSAAVPDQVPVTEDMTYKVVALARFACPRANIPSTTALATLNRADGREKGLMRGANVVMPNLTPAKYRRLYEIYPNKACVAETPAECGACLPRRIRAIGRTVGSGRGDARAAAKVH